MSLLLKESSLQQAQTWSSMPTKYLFSYSPSQSAYYCLYPQATKTFTSHHMQFAKIKFLFSKLKSENTASPSLHEWRPLTIFVLIVVSQLHLMSMLLPNQILNPYPFPSLSHSLPRLLPLPPPQRIVTTRALNIQKPMNKLTTCSSSRCQRRTKNHYLSS